MHVLIDLSALHGNNLALLARSPLPNLVRSRKVVVHLTPVLVEETLAGILSTRKAGDWRPRLALLVSMCNGEVFLDKPDLIANELLCGRGTHARHAEPNRPSRKYTGREAVLQRLRELADGQSPEIPTDVHGEVAQNRARSRSQRAQYSALRSDTAERLKALRQSSGVGPVPFSPFCIANRIAHGRLLIDRLLEHRAKASVADTWSRNPARFPFFTSFVDGFSFAAWYAATYQSSPLDVNAQADYEQLCYLNWADAMVSNDAGFLRHAFDALWKPRGRRLFSTNDFVELLMRIA
jgi:hypothetical protein